MVEWDHPTTAFMSGGDRECRFRRPTPHTEGVESQVCCRQKSEAPRRARPQALSRQRASASRPQLTGRRPSCARFDGASDRTVYVGCARHSGDIALRAHRCHRFEHPQRVASMASMEWSGIYGAYGSILGSMAQSPIKLRGGPESFPLDGSGHRFVVPKDLGVQG